LEDDISMATQQAARSGVQRTATIVIGVVVVDAASKAAALALASRDYGLGVILPVQNPDFSLGVASAAFPIMLALSTLGILAFGGYTTLAAARGSLPAWIPGLLVGGGIGNLADRVLFGAVHDWLDLGKVVVNLADLAVLVGFLGFAWIAFNRRGRSTKSEFTQRRKQE
jgi:lipoprotein signal peptidase